MKKLLPTLLFTALSFCSFQKLHAQWTTDTLANTRVADQNTVQEVTPLQGTTTSGKTYVSWFQSAATGYEMRMQLLDVNGNKLWTSNGLVISSHPQSSAVYRYDLKVDKQNNAIVAFQDTRLGNMTTVAYKIDSSGNFLWGADGIVLHDTASTMELAPSIGILPNNDVIIAWNGSNGSVKTIPYEKISAAGTVLWSYPLVLTGANRYSRPTVLGLSTLGFMMVFAEESGSGLGVSMIKAQVFDSAGAALLASWTSVINTATGFASFPKVVSDEHDGCYVAILTGTPGAPSMNDVFVQHVYDYGGIAWGASGIEASSLAGNHKEPASIAFRNADNHIYVLMKVLDNTQGQAGVYAQALDTAGTKLMTANGAMLRPLSSANYHEPNGWTDAGNGFITIYTEGTTGNKLKSVKMDYNGTLLWNGNAVTLCAVVSTKGNVSVGTFTNGKAAIVWEDARVDEGVYAQNIRTDGSLGVISAVDETAFTDAPFTVRLTENLLQVTTTAVTSYELQLYTVEGKLIINQKLSGNAELSHQLSQGIYLYRIVNDGKSFSQKLGY